MLTIKKRLCRAAFYTGIALAFSAHATEPPLIEPDQGALGIHTVSWHSRRDYPAENILLFGRLLHQRREDFCQVNPGLYYRASSGFTVGAYRNSFCRGTVYAGWTWESESKRWWAMAGVAKYGDWRPMVAMGPALRLDKDLGLDSFGPTTVRLGWLPAVRARRQSCPPAGCLAWPTVPGGVWPKDGPVHVLTLTIERPF